MSAFVARSGHCYFYNIVIFIDLNDRYFMVFLLYFYGKRIVILKQAGIKKNKKAVVIGAGIIGLATALRLAQSGFDVSVIEQKSNPGTGSSKANAGQLLYDRISAMGSPGFLRSLPKTILNPDQGVIVNQLLKPNYWPWAASFIGQCTTKAWQENTQNLLMIAKLSRREMAKFNKQYEIDFNWRKPGKLIIYPDAKALNAAALSAKFQQQFGGEHQVFSKEQCIEYEPALRESSQKIFGAIYLPDAEVGDCHKFCQNLAQILIDSFGVEIKYNTKVEAIEHNNDQVRALRTDHGIINGDLFIVATGSDAPTLLAKNFPEKQPAIGIKGISVTYPLGETPPNLSVTDAAGKFVILRLHDQVRVAGYAIFSDNLDINPTHVQRLEQKARQLMPKAANYDASPEIWTGLRPQTPNDCPMIGRAGYQNLYVNAGHGSMGWMLAFGSAQILLDKITETNTEA